MVEEAAKKSYFSLFGLVGLWFGLKVFNNGEISEHIEKGVPVVVRYIIYLLLVQGIQKALHLLDKIYAKDLKTIDYKKLLKRNVKYFIIFGVAAYKADLKMLFSDDLQLFCIAYLICLYPEMDKQPMINYGTGMACSFFEGYLVHVIPSDGAKFVGFQENIRALEAREGIVFPVPRLFIVITKSLFCPPDLAHFNKLNKEDSLPHMEAIKSLREVIKSVAGVQNRSYKNSAYKIVRPAGPPVYVAAEFATPLHTLHKVLQKRGIYEQLCNVDVDEIVGDFCAQLERTIARCPDCRGKCELVHYDDTNENENLADVLLAKIAEIEPNFEEVIARGPR